MSGIIEIIRATIGIDVVLGHYDHAVGRYGRMACPIHGGRNPSAFSVRDNAKFRCFNCDAAGDVVDLEVALGGGTIAEAIQRLCERHGIDHKKTIDLAIVRRRKRRLAQLNAWYDQRMNEWTAAFIEADNAVREWQCEPAEADFVYWLELKRRVQARDRAEAMLETFRRLRMIEDKVNAYIVEQRGSVILPAEVLRCA